VPSKTKPQRQTLITFSKKLHTSIGYLLNFFQHAKLDPTTMTAETVKTAASGTAKKGFGSTGSKGDC